MAEPRTDASGRAPRPAAFVDRDGTIVVERSYLADPDAVELVPGVGPALRRLQRAGYAIVVVTNQSGIARGLYAESDFRAVQQRLGLLLREHGVHLDGVYHCPHHPDHTGPCECRKPAPGMYRRAARELGLDLAASYYIGDRVKDVLPALDLGGTGVLVLTGYGREETKHAPAGVALASDLPGAVDLILGAARPAYPGQDGPGTRRNPPDPAPRSDSDNPGTQG